MKKLVAAGLVLVSLGASAQFKLDAEMTARGEYRHGFGNLFGEDSKAASFIGQRTRLNADYKTKDYQFYVSLQDVRVWGDVPQLNSSDKNKVAVHQAWGQINFNSNFNTRIGRQEIILDDSRIFGNVGWALQARSHDALLMNYTKNSFSVKAALAYNQDGMQLEENTYYTPKNYKSMQFAWLNKKWNKLNASLLLLNKGDQFVDPANADNNETRYSQTLGTHLKYKASSSLNLSANAYYQIGEDKSAMDLNAYLLSAEVNYKLSKANLALGAEVLSGNDMNSSSEENNAFTPFFGTNHKFNGFMDYFYVGNHSNSVGLVDLYAKINTKLGKRSNLTMFVHNFSSNGNIVDAQQKDASKQLGTELDLVYGYKLNKDVLIKAGYSQMFASKSMEYIKNKPSDNTNNWAWLMVSIKPNLFTSK